MTTCFIDERDNPTQQMGIGKFRLLALEVLIISQFFREFKMLMHLVLASVQKALYTT